MDLGDALAYLDGHLNREATAGRLEGLHLDHMRRLVEVLGDPHLSFPAITITGTNGKGSVARMVTALLVECGLSVGTYTSPHLEQINERMAWNGEPIGDGALAELIASLAAVEPMLGITPSWFELMTAAALRWFADVAVDVAVLEVGLLGRFDATTVVDADVAVITNIGFDHTDGVGAWREAIASEKAGIIKPGSFLVLGETSEALRPLFLAEHPRQTWEREVDFEVTASRAAVGGRLIDIRTPLGRIEDLFIPVHGGHQADNAVVAVAAVEAFFGRAVDRGVADQAFAGLAIPGRLEVLGHGPLVLVDGAHNPPGAEAAAVTVAEDFDVAGRRVLVVGMLGGRDVTSMLEAFDAGSFDLVVATQPVWSRGVPAETVAEVAVLVGAEVVTIDDVAGAVDHAIHEAGADGLVLIAGSLYVAGEARGHLSGRRA